MAQIVKFWSVYMMRLRLLQEQHLVSENISGRFGCLKRDGGFGHYLYIVSRSDSASDVDVDALVYSSVCWTLRASAIMCVGVTSDV